VSDLFFVIDSFPLAYWRSFAFIRGFQANRSLRFARAAGAPFVETVHAPALAIDHHRWLTTAESAWRWWVRDRLGAHEQSLREMPDQGQPTPFSAGFSHWLASADQFMLRPNASVRLSAMLGSDSL
jgi:hypothetical protein